jgi:hypothetical protein
MQRLRPTLIALAILALSATAVFAAAPSLPAFGPGSHHSEASMPAKPSHAAEATEKAEPTEAEPDASGAAANHPVNHGCVVSAAAKAATPSGFKNHGQWVSSVAKANKGHGYADPTTCDLPAGSPAPSTGTDPTNP